MVRARIEAVLAGLFAIGTVATLIWPTWIESLSGLAPDQGNGEAEWWLVVLLGVVTVAVGAIARRDYRIARVHGATDSA